MATEPPLRKVEHLNVGIRRGYIEPVRALTLLAALCTLVAAGCGGGSDGEAAAPAPPPVTETAGPEDKPMRPTAPPIEGTTLDGGTAVLADLRGKQVFVNVWSSW